MSTITDNYARADSDSLGSSAEGWSWTEVSGDADIVSQTARGGAPGGNYARAEIDLDSEDHYAEVKVNAHGGDTGPIIRFSSSALTGYVVFAGVSSTRLFKIVSGTPTQIGSDGPAVASNSVVRLSGQGSTLKVYDDGVEIMSETNGDITGNRRTGKVLVDSSSEVDNFAAGDLEPPVDEAIWQLAALISPALVDLLAIVDDPSGTPTTKKITLSDFATLTISNVVVQVKTVGSGTYTPTAAMKKVLAIAVGAGGGGHGGINTDSAGGGGGGGGTCVRLLSAADIGASKSYVVGAGGSAGNAGTATTLDGGTLLNAGGGGAGSAGAAFTVVGVQAAGGAGGTAANGTLNIPGQPGERGVIFDGTNGLGGRGGRSVFGFGGAPGGSNVAGNNGSAYGGGGAGGHASGTQDRAGGAGADGILFLLEFLG